MTPFICCGSKIVTSSLKIDRTSRGRQPAHEVALDNKATGRMLISR